MSRNPYAEHQPSSGGGGYLRFEDGKSVRVRILSDVAIFDNVYEGKVSGAKYAWIVYNTGEEEVQIMQLPKGGYLAVAAIAVDEDYGNPLEAEYELKITRTGHKAQTKYSVVPVKATAKIEGEITEQVASIDLIDRLSKTPSASRPAWLNDEIDGKRPEASAEDEAAEDDDVSDDDLIDLDNIPL